MACERSLGPPALGRVADWSLRDTFDVAHNRTVMSSLTQISPHTLATVGSVIADEVAEDRDFRADWQRLAFARHVAVELIRYRAERGLSQGKLAERLEISQPRVAKLESGEYNPRIETVIEITRKTGIEFAFDTAPAASAPKLLTKAGKEQVAEEFDGVVVRVASAAHPRGATA